MALTFALEGALKKTKVTENGFSEIFWLTFKESFADAVNLCLSVLVRNAPVAQLQGIDRVCYRYLFCAVASCSFILLTCNVILLPFDKLAVVSKKEAAGIIKNIVMSVMKTAPSSTMYIPVEKPRRCKCTILSRVDKSTVPAHEIRFVYMNEVLSNGSVVVSFQTCFKRDDPMCDEEKGSMVKDISDPFSDVKSLPFE